MDSTERGSTVSGVPHAGRGWILEFEDGGRRLDALFASKANKDTSDPERSEQAAADGGAPLSELFD